jgi:hypothetical protein
VKREIDTTFCAHSTYNANAAAENKQALNWSRGWNNSNYFAPGHDSDDFTVGVLRTTGSSVIQRTWIPNNTFYLNQANASYRKGARPPSAANHF